MKTERAPRRPASRDFKKQKYLLMKSSSCRILFDVTNNLDLRKKRGATSEAGHMMMADNLLSVSIENYLETIFLLVQEHTVARAKDISERLKVSRSSVTGMLQALRNRGLVNYERYGFVTLTQEGVQVASSVVRRHEALREFMVSVLSIDRAEADAAACHMEHGISKHIVDRFIEFADFVQTCPRAGAKWVHGFGYRCEESSVSPLKCESCIEQCLEDVREHQKKGESAAMSISLSDLKPGEKAQIERVAGAGAVKRRIRDMGVTTGSLVEVVRVAPLGDPMDVKIKGYHLSLRKEEAADIIVKKVNS
ncbi:MAG: metal-dependent transcriptional regulator [Kiritimatiellia bacterium]|nr:metal-dependent transcriptional regulator [Kiritimatiellia bacterium]